jgi:uncharacterized protein with gpF-like domain
VDNSIRSALISVIQAKRKNLGRAQRQRGIKPQRWLYPWATEHRYAATIRAWFRPVRDYAHKYLKENQEAILRGDSADSLSAARLDAVPGKHFKIMIDSLNGWLGQYVPDDDESKSGSPIYMGLGSIADSTFDFNEGQYEKGAKSALGVEFPVGEDWWPQAKENWKQFNYQIISNDLRKYVSDINSLTERAVTSGLSVKELTKQIQALDDKITKNRAEFIARDQIGKLNGQITQMRMESVGLTMYIWETSGDERVRGTPKEEGGIYPNARPSHYLMDEKLCRWDNSSVCSEDGGKTWIDRPDGAVLLHPGDDYQCRCTATAYWQELVGEADAGETGTETTAATVPGSTARTQPKLPEISETAEKRIKELAGKVTAEKEAVELGGLLLDKAGKENRDIFSVMGGYRKFGSSETHEFAKGSAKANKTRIADAQKYFPKDWLQKSIQDAKDNGLKTSRARRGSYVHARIWDKDRKKYISQIALSEHAQCAHHEMAHRMEFLFPEIIKLEKEFYERRTMGNSLIEIRKINGYNYFPKGEKARTDEFAHPYIGKDYGGIAYELLSMGFENLVSHKYNTDKEFDAFIVGLLMGVK